MQETKCLFLINAKTYFIPDLIPVSSTVIPLPVYKVSFGINVLSAKDEKLKRPEGPIELETGKIVIFQSNSQSIPISYNCC